MARHLWRTTLDRWRPGRRAARSTAAAISWAGLPGPREGVPAEAGHGRRAGSPGRHDPLVDAETVEGPDELAGARLHAADAVEGGGVMTRHPGGGSNTEAIRS